MTASLVVLASGSGSNLQAILDACAAKTLNARVAFVVVNRREARALDRAEGAGVPTLYHPLKWYLETGRTRADYDADLAARVAEHHPDWIILAGWMHVLGMSFLGRFPGKVINLHPALPGQFPGVDAIQRAFEAFTRGEIYETGIMIHYVPDAGVDTGPVIASQRVPILPGDSLETLTARMHAAEHALLVETLKTLTG